MTWNQIQISAIAIGLWLLSAALIPPVLDIATDAALADQEAQAMR